MIKKLISDLAHDSITVSQGLTRAKIIARKVGNETFRKWIDKEMSGYENKDPMLPEYRVVDCTLHLKLNFGPYGRKDTGVIMPDDKSKFYRSLTKFKAQQPITLLEKQLTITDGEYAIVHLPDGYALELFNLWAKNDEEIEGRRRYFEGVYKKFPRVAVIDIIEQTKQKLIDTLLDLDEQFPELENDFPMSEENKERANNIITNNIYGGHVPMNLSTGDNANQNINQTIQEIDYEKLKAMGVGETEVEELRTIVTTTPDKPSRAAKVGAWVMTVVAGMISKGMADQAPAIIEYMKHMVQ